MKERPSRGTFPGARVLATRMDFNDHDNQVLLHRVARFRTYQNAHKGNEKRISTTRGNQRFCITNVAALPDAHDEIGQVMKRFGFAACDDIILAIDDVRFRHEGRFLHFFQYLVWTGRAGFDQ